MLYFVLPIIALGYIQQCDSKEVVLVLRFPYNYTEVVLMQGSTRIYIYISVTMNQQSKHNKRQNTQALV